MSYAGVIKFELPAYQNEFRCRHNIIPHPISQSYCLFQNDKILPCKYITYTHMIQKILGQASWQALPTNWAVKMDLQQVQYSHKLKQVYIQKYYVLRLFWAVLVRQRDSRHFCREAECPTCIIVESQCASRIKYCYLCIRVISEEFEWLPGSLASQAQSLLIY